MVGGIRHTDVQLAAIDAAFEALDAAHARLKAAHLDRYVALMN